MRPAKESGPFATMVEEIKSFWLVAGRQDGGVSPTGTFRWLLSPFGMVTLALMKTGMVLGPDAESRNFPMHENNQIDSEGVDLLF